MEQKYNHPVWLKNRVDFSVLYEELKVLPSAHKTDDILETSLSKTLKTLKIQFENHQHQTIQAAHKKINQYEKVGSLIFQNRAAVKLLNINADTGFILDRSNFNLTKADIFFFADLCGGE